MSFPKADKLTPAPSPAPWEVLSRKLLQKTVVFDLFVQRLKSPRNGVEDDFYYIDVVDWVNVIALTPAQEVVMVEQFRFGIHDVSLELPGGMLDGADADPAKAVLRELQEETGYVVESLVPLGSVHPNPAIQTNRCHFFFAEDARLESGQNLDRLEDIAVRLVPLNEIPELIVDGAITHSLMTNAFLQLMLRRGEFSFDPIQANS